MYYIYILYSPSADKYYIGYSSNPVERLNQHNTNPRNTYTSKYRPWVVKTVFECSTIKAEAMRIEKFIKRQKNRRMVEVLCDPQFIPTGSLAQLVRVPQLRD